MKAVNVSGLKNNPSEALREARKDVVVVMNRDKPEALMIGVELTGGRLDVDGVLAALATSLFRDDMLSLGRSARLAGMTVGEFATHVSRQGIPVIKMPPEEVDRDIETMERWVAASSSATPAR